MDLKFEDLPTAIAQLLAQNKLILEAIQEIALSEQPSGQVLTLNKICDLFELKRQTIYSYVSKGIIPHYKKAGKLYFIKDEILDWITSKLSNPKIRGVRIHENRLFRDRGFNKI
ncbi:helix-turn-helix domain-containing protein [Echinicola marina]|uniref:helix-turn-helix domain-containing protein n=1 Tax=Echinicola marina TaxID=2859768 RepID=UPI001CF66EEA|nr:helix-turn-helix domain-containing protein [Echinicola marina]UCS94014.1 helix-turn-helix domain-containing protein [Echinicola marina]